jgi:hypothetical protein
VTLWLAEDGTAMSPPSINGTALRYVPDPRAALGDPYAVLDDPHSVLGDPRAALDDPHSVLGDPRAALGDPQAAFAVAGTDLDPPPIEGRTLNRWRPPDVPPARAPDPRMYTSRPPIEDFPPAEPDLRAFRAAVAELTAEIAQCPADDGRFAEHILTKRIDEWPFCDVLSGTPEGREATISKLLFDVRNYQPGPRSAVSIAALVRISMLTQIDALWWGHYVGYETDDDVYDSMQLVDLDELAFAGELGFSYRHQADTFLSRAARSAERRALPGRSPRTAGVSFARALPEVVDWLNLLADEFAEVAPPGTPALWVTSLARSVSHQRHLRSLGYLAPLPSAHCVGSAIDIEIAWYRRFRAHRLLRGLILDHQRADEINVIDEGQAWHVCLRPEGYARVA